MSEVKTLGNKRSKMETASLAGVGIMVLWTAAATIMGWGPSDATRRWVEEGIERRVEKVAQPLRRVLPPSVARFVGRGVVELWDGPTASRLYDAYRCNKG